MPESFDRLKTALADRYEIQRELGEGGMATVYLARDLKHDRNVALKVLRPELAATMGPDRFLQEVRVTANLQHPHILPLFDSGEANGFLYYVMPYLEGESLRDRLTREGELPVAEAVKILRAVTDALAAAHEVGVVHRDIKPDNVMLSGRHAVVADFGVAKAVSEATGRHQLTTKGVALGTPAYMAPEQAAADENIDHRADIYALGAMGYELLAGRPPFVGPTAQQVLAAQVTEAPRPVTELRETVPAGLGDVLMRCLAKKPADRWQSAEELLKQLEFYATPGTGTTPAQMQPTMAIKGSTAAPVWMKLAAPVAVLAILAAVWLGVRGTRPLPTDTGTPVGAALALRPDGFVVVPFVNQTGVDSLATLGSVLADYLTGQVSRNRIGWVAPASTVRELAAERPEGTETVPYFAGETGARYVVSGSYFRQGRALMVQAEVSDAETGELVASVEPVEGSLTDFMDTATAAAEQVLVVLARILDPNAAPPSVGGTPRSFAAYQDFAQGWELWLQGDRARALDLFYRALDKDSTYAEALLAASTTEWNLGDIARADTVAQIAERYRDQMSPWDVVTLDWLQGFFAGDREEIYRVGRQWAELDPVRGGDCRGAVMAGHFREAVEDCMKWYDRSYDKTGVINFFWTDLLASLHLLGRHEEELEHAQTARRYNPSSRGAFLFEGFALAALGRVEEVQSLMAEARTHGDAFNQGSLLREVGMDLRYHGHPEAAQELLEQSLRWYEEADQYADGMAETLFDLSQYREAKRVAEAAVAESPTTQGYGVLGSAAAALGDRGTAVAMEEVLLEREAVPYVFGTPARWRALIRAQLGDLDVAVEFLEEAYAAGSTFGRWLHTKPQLDALRGYPAFERFIAPR